MAALNTELRQKVGTGTTTYQHADSLIYIRGHFDLMDGSVPSHEHAIADLSGAGSKIYYTNSSGVFTALSIDALSDTKVLTSNGLNVAPSWEDAVSDLAAATSLALGGIKIGYSQSDTNRAVALSGDKAYVVVPKATSTVYGTSRMALSGSTLTITT